MEGHINEEKVGTNTAMPPSWLSHCKYLEECNALFGKRVRAVQCIKNHVEHYGMYSARRTVINKQTNKQT